MDEKVLVIVYLEGGEVTSIAANNNNMVNLIVVDLDKQQDEEGEEGWAEWRYVGGLTEAARQEAEAEANKDENMYK